MPIPAPSDWPRDEAGNWLDVDVDVDDNGDPIEVEPRIETSTAAVERTTAEGSA